MLIAGPEGFEKQIEQVFTRFVPVYYLKQVFSDIRVDCIIVDVEDENCLEYAKEATERTPRFHSWIVPTETDSPFMRMKEEMQLRSLTYVH